MNNQNQEDKHGRCWSRFYTLAALVLILGGVTCVTLLSWAELKIGTPSTPNLSSPMETISLLRHHLGFSSNTLHLAEREAADSSSSTNSGAYSQGLVISLPVSTNSSDGGNAGVAASADMSGMDSLWSAVESFRFLGTAGLQSINSSTNSTQRAADVSSTPSSSSTSTSTSSTNEGSTTRSIGSSAILEGSSASSGVPARQATAAAMPAPRNLSLPRDGGTAMAGGSANTTVDVAASKPTASSTSSTTTTTTADQQSINASCFCLRVDAEQLRKQCSVTGWDWPDKNEQLVTRCMDFLASNTSQYMQLQHHDPSKDISCTRQLQMHTFWSGPMTWKLKAVIQSFLFTHYTEDTSCRPKPVLNIWLQTVDPTRSQLEKWAQEWNAPYFLCSDQLSFKQWSNDGWLDWLPASMFVSAANSTINATALHAAVRASAQSGSRVSYSDAVRFLVLYRFGGIYTDGDVLMLRNMEPLSHFDFVYEWSFVKGGMNTAVFGTQQHSPFAAAVIQTALTRSITVNASGVYFDPRLFNGLFHPLTVLRRVPQRVADRVQPLPSIPFDPIWLTIDTPNATVHNITQIHKVRAWKDFFIKPPAYLVPPKLAADVFKGAFTHHWHNNWHLPLVQSSLIGQLVSSYDAFLTGTQPNPQGVKAASCSDLGRPKPT